MTLRGSITLALVLHLVLLSGCANLGQGTTEGTRTYHLAAAEPIATSDADFLGPTLGVGPVKLAPYLDRPQIVTRTHRNQLALAPFDRWAAPLHENLVRVLAEDLQWMVPARSIVLYPWRRSETPNLQLTVDVVRFDGALDGEVVLKAHWALFDAEGALLVQQSSRIVAAVESDEFGYLGLVGAMNRCLEALSKEIATLIRQGV